MLGESKISQSLKSDRCLYSRIHFSYLFFQRAIQNASNTNQYKQHSAFLSFSNFHYLYTFSKSKTGRPLTCKKFRSELREFCAPPQPILKNFAPLRSALRSISLILLSAPLSKTAPKRSGAAFSFSGAAFSEISHNYENR